ncbi:MAG TPA: EVE domain-containing protein [Anaeromyxobacteraceae bacterium]|nr:EVE domain-containing protein [Anaeromyxobacteraceae bacterium]
MAFWLLKTEPSTYSFADLVRERRTRWDGVTNPQALANLRAMKAGDEALVYHSGAKEAVGLARVVAESTPDPRDPTGKLVAVDLAAERALPAPVGLEALKAEAAFRGSPLLRQGRLSVVPLTAEQWRAVLRLSKAPTRP